MDAISDYQYCRTRVAADGSKLYYATLFMDEAKKRILIPLLCFEAEMIRILQTCQDPGVARLKLLWWSEEIDRLYRHRAGHPISRALAEIIAVHTIDRARLIGPIAHADSLICIEQPESLDACIRVLMNGPGTIWRLSAEIGGCSDPDTLEVLAKTAAVNALFGLLGQTAFHLRQDRIFIPGGYLSRASIPACLNQEAAELRAVFIPLFTELRRYLQRLYERMPATDRRQQLHALILCRLLARQCGVDIRHCDSFLRQRHALSPLSKLFIAWKIKHFWC